MASSETGDGRARLLEATLSCMADYGYQGTTVRKIAERAEVTAGLVRHHFDSKESLLIESYRQINQAALARMAAAARGADGEEIERALERALRAFFPVDLSDPRQMRIMAAFWGLVLTNPKIAAIQQATYSAFQAHFVGLIEGHAGPRDDAREIANGIIALADGLWLECCLNPQRMTPEAAIETALGFARARIAAAD
ncbi:MAG: TetR family transcriptional regulator C-terminal domain-containing protein [Pseudomonadota bacterium]